MLFTKTCYTTIAMALLLMIPVLSLDIPNLTYASKPGQITITYKGTQNFAVTGPLTLAFSLNQQGGIPSWWGSPFLNWKLVSQSGSSYQFTNQATLDNFILKPGQVVTFQYNPNPYNSVIAPSQVKLTVAKMISVQAPVKFTVDESLSYQRTITITNTSPNVLNTAGSILKFSYTGGSISNVWGDPYVAWTIQKTASVFTLTASLAAYMPQIAGNGKFTVIFSGSGKISNLAYSTLQIEGSTTSPTTNNSSQVNNTTPANQTNTTAPTNNTSLNNTNSNQSNNTTPVNNTNPGKNNSTNTTSTNNTNSTTSSSKKVVGYFESWSEIWSYQGESLTLAKLPSYINVVNIAFMKPDAQYYGLLDLSYTGLQFIAAGPVVRDAVAALKYQNPNTKVLISIGGPTYKNWDQLNPTAIAKVVKELGLDGVDIDYEPTQPGCKVTSGKVSCASDSQYQNIISKLRAALPRPYIISIAAFNVGAYGEGVYASAQPSSAYTGVAVNLLRSQQATSIDFINLMAYDASPVYSPTQSYNAYKSYFSGPVMIGVKVPPESSGGHVLTLTEVNSLTSFVNQNNGGGMMIWSLQKKPSGTVSNSNPNAIMISQAICSSFNLGNCTKSLGA